MTEIERCSTRAQPLAAGAADGPLPAQHVDGEAGRRIDRVAADLRRRTRPGRTHRIALLGRRNHAQPADHAAHLRRSELPAGAALPSRARTAEAGSCPAPHSPRTADESATRRPACGQLRQSLTPQHTSRASCFQYLRCVRTFSAQFRAATRTPAQRRQRRGSTRRIRRLLDSATTHVFSLRVGYSPQIRPFRLRSDRTADSSPAVGSPRPCHWHSGRARRAHPHHQTSTRR